MQEINLYCDRHKKDNTPCKVCHVLYCNLPNSSPYCCRCSMEGFNYDFEDDYFRYCMELIKNKEYKLRKIIII